MIDLDKEWSSTDELYCQFGTKLLLGVIPYQSWRSFCYAYCHYRYVLPDHRILNEALLDAIYGKTRKTAAEMMRFVLLVGQIEAHFTEDEQARMLSILVQKPPPRMEKSPAFMV